MNILNPKFRYTSAAQTDIGARFKRIQRQYAKAWDEAHAENARRDEDERQQKVRKIGGVR